MRVFLLRADAAEAAHAPEYVYLASWVELQARRAFEEVVLFDDREADPCAAMGPGDAALLLGSERLLVTARSLTALRKALEEGADAAVPRRLAEVPGLAETPVYTLRGFERLERRVLAGPAPPPSPSSGPLALVTRRELDRRLAGRRWPEVVGRLGGSGVQAGGPGPTGVGLFHEFVDYYGEARTDVLPHLPPGIRDVLEVGCGRGVTGELLRRELGARVTGVELNPVVAQEAAGRLDRVVAGDVEDPAIAEAVSAGGPYDLVLALELFEHLAFPERFLAAARRWLRPGGTVVLSTPNVGHYSVVEDLLAGRWDYLPIGLLCYTHLRFFTRRTLEDWLGRLGFERFRLIPQQTEEPPWTGSAGDLLELDRESLRTKAFWVVIEV